MDTRAIPAGLAVQDGTRSDAVTDLERDTIRRINRRFMPILVVAYMVSFIDRVNVGFAALTANRELGLSATAYGWGAGIFFLGYFLFEYPSNVMMGRVGARLWLSRIMITWGFISAGMALVTGPVSFCIARFLLGVAEAGFFPGLLLFAALWYPKAYRARCIGIMLVGMAVSSLVGAPISGLLLGLDGWLGLSGWQWMYILEGLPAVFLGVLLLFVLTDTPDKAEWLSREQRDWLRRTLAAEPARAHAAPNVWATIRDPRVLFYALLFFNVTTASYGLSLWLPQIVKAAGLTNAQTGFVTAIPYAFGTLAMVLGGWWSDRHADRIVPTAAMTFLVAAGLTASVWLAAPLAQFAAICVVMIGIYGLKGPSLALYTERFPGPAAAGSIAMVTALGNLSGFLPPYLVGWIKDATGQFSYGLLFLAVVAFLGGVQALLAPAFERRIAAAAAR
jgi:MFS transporter, ACS family, tartrate transporter